jgi:hypothetical protein
MEVDTIKKCTKCGNEKELKYFSFRNDTKKYRSQCRKCSKGYSRLLGDSQKEIDLALSLGKKRCGKCTDEKSISEFHKDKYTRTGYASECKKCRVDYSKATSHIQKARTAKTRYNLSDEKYNTLMKISECEICGTDITKGFNNKHIDHCHSTKKVRGILCRNCNLGLGFFNDNSDYLLKAINYLKYK